MLKKFRILSGFDDAIKTSIGTIVSSLNDLYGDISAHEEQFSPQLASEITLHLVNEIRNNLNGTVINGVRFEVYAYNHPEENTTGADLAGIIEINYGERQIKKMYLAQAKVCQVRSSGSRSQRNTIFKRDSNIQRQAEKMISITSDSFFFLYSNRGIDVIPALEIYSSGENLVDTGKHYYLNFKDFYEMFFKCFIGDHKVAPYYRDFDELKRISKKFNASNVLKIIVNVPEIH